MAIPSWLALLLALGLQVPAVFAREARDAAAGTAPVPARPDMTTLGRAAAFAPVQRKRFLRERDFTADRSLAAEPGDLVLLDLESGPRAQVPRQNLVPYRLTGGTYRFCLRRGDANVTRLTLDLEAGKRLLSLDQEPREPDGSLERKHNPAAPQHSSARRARAQPHCQQVTLQSGVYQLNVWHDPRQIGAAPRVAFVQFGSAAEPRLVNADGTLAGGFWALRPDPTLDPLRRQGRIIAQPPDRSVSGTPYTALRPLVADFTAQAIDNTGLFSFATATNPVVSTTPLVSLSAAKLDSSGLWTTFADDAPAGRQPFFQTHPLVVTDLGGYRISLGVQRADGKPADFFLSQSTFSPTTVLMNYDEPQPDPAPAAAFNVLFRFYADGTQIGALQEGEVAIFQECNYQGKAAVFASDVPNLAAITSAVVTLDKTAASVRLGNNTGVVFNTGAGYSGVHEIIEADTPCLDGTPIGSGTTSSFFIRPLFQTLIATTRQCVQCQLAGVDFTGADLSGGVNLHGANLTGATLTEANFAGASLEGAVLDGLSGVSVDLSGAFLHGASLKKANLSNGKLYGAQFIQAELEGADLSGAFLTNCPAPQCSPSIPAAASFGGAHLKNVSLASADLSGVDFTTASFYGASAVGASTCTFSNGNCATAASATMNNTQFNQAYLYGVDFTDAIVQGVQFGGAVLIGANFTGATLSVDTRVGTNAGFQNAFLQGTQLASATLIDTSLANAFVDFRPGGNVMYLNLNPVYTYFPGWHSPGQPICALVFYGAPTTVPASNTTLTCPNGQPADSTTGCGPATATPPLNLNWKSTLELGPNSTPPASYLEPATYTPAAATPICSSIDTNW